MGHRLPTILGKAIEDTYVTLNELSNRDQIQDLLACIVRMNDLLQDLREVRDLRPIFDDGEGDVHLWNKAIARYFAGKNWMSATWLFAEAYKYRRLHECFSKSKYFKVCSHYQRVSCWALAYMWTICSGL